MAVQAVAGLRGRSPNRLVVAAGLALLLVGMAALAAQFGTLQAALFGLGVMLGLVLYHALFGFASSWRALVSDGRGAGLRAQMAMLALASLLFLPALDAGSLFGRPMELPVGPAAIARAAGVPMVPVFIFREGRHRSRVFIRAPISVPSTDDRTALNLPYKFCIHPRFPSRIWYDIFIALKSLHIYTAVNLFNDQFFRFGDGGLNG